MPGLTFVILIVAIGLLVLIPTRRLFVAGWKSGPLATYFAGMIVLALLVAEVRGPARYLVPILVLAYIAPFITLRQGLNRIRQRLDGTSAAAPPHVGRSAAPGPPPPPRNVTPPEARPPDAGR